MFGIQIKPLAGTPTLKSLGLIPSPSSRVEVPAKEWRGSHREMEITGFQPPVWETVTVLSSQLQPGLLSLTMVRNEWINEWQVFLCLSKTKENIIKEKINKTVLWAMLILEMLASHAGTWQLCF